MLVFVIALWWSLFASHKTVLVFTTGSGKGLYYRLATELKSVIEDNHPDIIIKLQTSAGSNENIKRLDAGEAQLRDERIGQARPVAAAEGHLDIGPREPGVVQGVTDRGDRHLAAGDARLPTEL